MGGVSSIPTRGSQVFSQTNSRRMLRGNLSNYSRHEVNSSLSPAKPGDGQQAESPQGKALRIDCHGCKKRLACQLKGIELANEKVQGVRQPSAFPLKQNRLLSSRGFWQYSFRPAPG
jgi:hypothetical protein